MTDDEQIVDVIRTELQEGVGYLDRSGHPGAAVTVAPPDWAGTIVEFSGRFDVAPDRQLWATVHVDPARVGWRIEAGLYEYLDSERQPHLVSELGSGRVKELQHALAEGRRLATSAWVAVRGYLERAAT
jgi:hypothetical protein